MPEDEGALNYYGVDEATLAATLRGWADEADVTALQNTYDTEIQRLRGLARVCNADRQRRAEEANKSVRRAGLTEAEQAALAELDQRVLAPSGPGRRGR